MILPILFLSYCTSTSGTATHLPERLDWSLASRISWFLTPKQKTVSLAPTPRVRLSVSQGRSHTTATTRSRASQSLSPEWPGVSRSVAADRRARAIFGTTLQAHSDSFSSSWRKRGPIPEVTGFLGFMACENSYEPAVGLPRSLRPVVPDATSQNLGWVGLQAFRYWNSAPNEVHWPPFSQHLLVLMTRPPAQMGFRYD
jgi:hypothetical protein